MYILIIIALCLFLLITAILPWVQRGQISSLQDEVDYLKRELRRIIPLIGNFKSTINDSVSAEAENEESSTGPVLPRLEPKHYENNITMPAWAKDRKTAETIEKNKNAAAFVKPVRSVEEIEPQEKKKPSFSFEQQFGARLPVWVGGIALVLAAVYMVRYSIEMGILNPAVRVTLGVIFAALMLYGAKLARWKDGIANGVRISQALAGAGIAVLYISAYSAANLYGLIPASVGFASMAGITALAVFLSLKHGMPIALLGLVGGFLTPALIGSKDPQAPLLFTYLYFVLAGLMFIIRKKQWWAMTAPVVIGAFSWVGIWLFGGSFAPQDSVYLGVFLIALSATVVVTSNKSSPLNYITVAVSLFLTAVIASRVGFGTMEWGMYGLLSSGAIALAFFNQRLYGLVPWFSMLVNAIMLMMWNTADTATFTITLSSFAALYIISGYALQLRSMKPIILAGLASSSALIYYFLAYSKLHNYAIIATVPYFWGMVAFTLAALSVAALSKVMETVSDTHPEKQYLMANYAATATAFLSIALTIELPHEFLSIALVIELFALAFINTKVDIKALPKIIGALACVFGLLLIPQIIELAEIVGTHRFRHIQKGVAIASWPIAQLGLPAALLLGSSYFLRKQKDSKLVSLLELFSITLAGVMAYYLIRHVFHDGLEVLYVKAQIVERSIITNVIFAYGLACLWAGRTFQREAFTLGGLVLGGIAVLRIIYFDMLVYNPLISAQAVGELPVFNTLLLVYGLPIFLTLIAVKELPHANKQSLVKFGYGFALLLAFTLLSYNVRQHFHGNYLNKGITTNAEIYSYSVAWLLFGIALLFFGTIKENKMIRLASLAIMILTVGKVFLYDASELEGLLRVFSFLGLGLSLIGLSWFYTRFVFSKDTQNSENILNNKL